MGMIMYLTDSEMEYVKMLVWMSGADKDETSVFHEDAKNILDYLKWGLQ